MMRALEIAPVQHAADVAASVIKAPMMFVGFPDAGTDALLQRCREIAARDAIAIQEAHLPYVYPEALRAHEAVQGVDFTQHIIGPAHALIYPSRAIEFEKSVFDSYAMAFHGVLIHVVDMNLPDNEITAQIRWLRSQIKTRATQLMVVGHIDNLVRKPKLEATQERLNNLTSRCLKKFDGEDILTSVVSVRDNLNTENLLYTAGNLFLKRLSSREKPGLLSKMQECIEKIIGDEYRLRRQIGPAFAEQYFEWEAYPRTVGAKMRMLVDSGAEADRVREMRNIVHDCQCRFSRAEDQLCKVLLDQMHAEWRDQRGRYPELVKFFESQQALCLSRSFCRSDVGPLASELQANPDFWKKYHQVEAARPKQIWLTCHYRDSSCDPTDPIHWLAIWRAHYNLAAAAPVDVRKMSDAVLKDEKPAASEVDAAAAPAACRVDAWPFASEEAAVAAAAQVALQEADSEEHEYSAPAAAAAAPGSKSHAAAARAAARSEQRNYPNSALFPAAAKKAAAAAAQPAGIDPLQALVDSEKTILPKVEVTDTHEFKPNLLGFLIDQPDLDFSNITERELLQLEERNTYFCCPISHTFAQTPVLIDNRIYCLRALQKLFPDIGKTDVVIPPYTSAENPCRPRGIEPAYGALEQINALLDAKREEKAAHARTAPGMEK